MKANHNNVRSCHLYCHVVSSTTKIVKWKQITTEDKLPTLKGSCFQYDKDSKMKANHNNKGFDNRKKGVVSSTTKIVKWKQITTCSTCGWPRCCCFQYDKDSKMKANHNFWGMQLHGAFVVSSTTKIVKWKQITTSDGGALWAGKLFPVRQR